jgi:hypothetical protein
MWAFDAANLFVCWWFVQQRSFILPAESKIESFQQGLVPLSLRRSWKREKHNKSLQHMTAHYHYTSQSHLPITLPSGVIKHGLLENPP